jgi:hypothetical protein
MPVCLPIGTLAIIRPGGAAMLPAVGPIGRQSRLI